MSNEDEMRLFFELQHLLDTQSTLWSIAKSSLAANHVEEERKYLVHIAETLCGMNKLIAGRMMEMQETPL